MLTRSILLNSVLQTPPPFDLGVLIRLLALYEISSCMSSSQPRQSGVGAWSICSLILFLFNARHSPARTELCETLQTTNASRYNLHKQTLRPHSNLFFEPPLLYLLSPAKTRAILSGLFTPSCLYSISIYRGECHTPITIYHPSSIACPDQFSV